MGGRELKMDARSEMLRKLRVRQEGYSLDQKFYVDSYFFQLDLEHIYYREWLFVGHECELATPGDYFTVQIGAYSLILLRRDDGTIAALHNTCRHRGSRICSAQSGTVGRRLICPYHQWTYHSDGRLATARQMGRDVDSGQLGLKRAHCERMAGYIFVSLADAPPDFASFRAHTEPYLLPHRLRETKIALSSTIVENGNWKLVWENNRECYHCAVNHPELCRTYPERPTVTGVKGAQNDPETVAHWQRCEAAGLPSKFRMADSGQYRTARMPLLGDAVSYTMNGKAAVAKPLSRDVTEPAIGAMVMFHYPSTWNHMLGDHAVTFRVLPLSPRETQVTTKWLVHKDAVEGIDYDLTSLSEVWMATNNQDRSIVEGNQIGISSPAYEPGPYSVEHEGGVMQFVDWYCRFMGTNLLETRPQPGELPIVKEA
jgi:Rieske 2Fe-2S family protein